MGDKVGWLGEKLCFGFGALFSLVVAVQAGRTACLGGWYSLFALVGLLGAGVLAWLGLRFLGPVKGFGAGLFGLRFLVALTVILVFGAQPVQDFQTMYQAACQLASGSREYLQGDYFYNWAYQTGFVAYEALVIKLFGEGLLPLQICNALWMAGTGCLVYGIARRFLSDSAAMTASLLYALFPGPYFLSAVLTNQHIAVFFYYLGLWLLLGERISPVRAVAAGVCLAVGNVMRPLGAVIVLAVLCWALVRMFRWKGHGVLKMGAPLLAAGVTYFICGELFDWLVRAGGLNPEGLANNLPLWKFVLGFNLEAGGAWNQGDYNAYYLLPREEAPQAMSQVVWQRLSSLGLGGFAALFWEKSSGMWGSLEYLYWGFGHLNGEASVVGGITLSQCLSALNYLSQGMYLLAFLLAGVALGVRFFQGGEGGLRVPVLLAFLVCGYYGVHLLIEVQPRYRYFLMPAVFLLAGAGADFLRGLWLSRKSSKKENPAP